jgi:hypothetical protein
MRHAAQDNCRWPRRLYLADRPSVAANIKPALSTCAWPMPRRGRTRPSGLPIDKRVVQEQKEGIHKRGLQGDIQ